MNYIDAVAERIYWLCNKTTDIPENEWVLYRIYAVLALSKGKETTRQDVHDAWSAWQAGLVPDHWSLVPFSCLAREIQDLDQPYVDAIHGVAHELAVTV
jgi:hypothetical protein